MYAHPRLQETYTGHEKTHGQNNFFWPFLTKTKQEWPLTGHFQGKFLLGTLHFGCQTLEPKMVGFVGSACAQATPMEKVWTAMYTKTKGNQFRNEWKLVSGLKFDNFFRISPKKCAKMKKRTFDIFWEGYWKPGPVQLPLDHGTTGSQLLIGRDFRVLKLCFQKTRTKSASHCQIKMEWLKDDWLNKWNVVLERHFH